jgi:hypothetical protein
MPGLAIGRHFPEYFNAVGNGSNYKAQALDGALGFARETDDQSLLHHDGETP